MNDLLQPDKLLDGEKVDARTLWASLESRQEFANWIKNRLADFIEGTDYSSFDKVINRETGASTRKDYLLTLNTAKHICLLERSEPGRKIRQYLIEVEKLWNSDDAVVNRALQIQNKKIRLLESRVSEAESRLAVAEPKAEILDKITATDSDVSVRGLASILAIPDLGQNKLFKRLQADGYIDGFNRPYRQHIEAGLMYEKEYYVPQLDATKRQLRITQKGVAYFARKYGMREAV